MTDPLPSPPDVAFGISARAVPPKKPSGAKTAIIVIALVFSVLLVLVGGLGALVYVVANREGSTAGVKPTDREHVITFEDLARHVADLKKEEGVEKLTRDDFLGSDELAYEYEPKDGALYISSSVTVDTSTKSARDTYNGMNIGIKVMFAAQGRDIGVEDHEELLEWGDDSHSVIITSEGKPFGNVFLARKGKRVFFLTVAGVYFKDPDAFAELVKPKLEKMESYDP